MPYNMELRNAPHDVAAHDADEVVLQGFMAESSATDPYPAGAVERQEWEQGHALKGLLPNGRKILSFPQVKMFLK